MKTFKNSEIHVKAEEVFELQIPAEGFAGVELPDGMKIVADETPDGAVGDPRVGSKDKLRMRADRRGDYVIIVSFDNTTGNKFHHLYRVHCR